MAATARLVVQMTPQEKQQVERKARQAGVTTAEYVRRRVAEDDIGEAREEILALLAALEDAGPRVLAGVDRAIAEADATIQAIRERRPA